MSLQSSKLALFFLVLGSSGWAAEWNIDPMHSQAAFAVRHMMVSTVHGYFSGIKGTVEYDAANPKAC